MAEHGEPHRFIWAQRKAGGNIFAGPIASAFWKYGRRTFLGLWRSWGLLDDHPAGDVPGIIGRRADDEWNLMQEVQINVALHRYNDGIDGKYGSQTKQALDRVLTELDLTGSGGLANEGTWKAFLSRARAAGFQAHSSSGIPGATPASSLAATHVNINRSYGVVAEKVHDRGTPSKDFLDTLIAWAQSADDEVFARNETYDIYTRVISELGPWNDLKDRKAVMCEVLRVLAGFESSWDWNEGRDLSANNTEHDTTEGGIFQCSSNSLGFFRKDPYLEIVLDMLGIAQPGPARSRAFLGISKSDHVFAIEYCARLLRHTINHHGPVRHYFGHTYKGKFHDGIGRHLKRDAVADFLTYL